MVPPGAPIVSDPVDLIAAPLASLAVDVSIWQAEKATRSTSVHWGWTAALPVFPGTAISPARGDVRGVDSTLKR